jgi:hypothetical protein
MSKERILPKSLHTITVLENLARHFMAVEGMELAPSMALALTVLKLNTMPDEYGLAAAALKKLEPKA